MLDFRQILLYGGIYYGKKIIVLYLQANLLKMYGILLRHFERDKSANNNLSKLVTFRSIIEYIADNYSENITLKSLAEQFNYSPVYISSVFATCAGMNFKYYLDNIRISKAVEMLMKTSLSISEIAAACGFENYAFIISK